MMSCLVQFEASCHFKTSALLIVSFVDTKLHDGFVCPEHLQFAGHCWHKLSVAIEPLGF